MGGQGTGVTRAGPRVRMKSICLGRRLELQVGVVRWA